MFRYPRRREFDIEPFKRDSGPHDIRYGLPHDVAFCKKCVISNQRPKETLIKATLPGFFVREAATPKFASS